MPWRGTIAVALCLLVATTARAQLINEILFDPHPDVSHGDANGDGQLGSRDDEFVEIVNQRPFALDLSGWTLSDAIAVRHVFPTGTVLPPRCAVVVFGGGSPTGDFGAALVQVASTGTLWLDNWGDRVRLGNDRGVVVQYTYPAGISDQSITREPDFGPEPLVPHGRVPGALGLQSPGTALDGRPFPGCRSVGARRSTWSAIKQLYGMP